MGSEREPARHICTGLLAHVDAGKTTLSEALLYRSGAIRSLGRVDHKDAFLDTDSLERERGITIFSKQAVFPLADREAILLDTPGHVDFSAEAERTLRALDCAVLVVSGSDGVQAHTRTLWRLLERHRVPTFLFVNKMDQPGTDRDELLARLRGRLGDGCADFSGPWEAVLEQARQIWTDVAVNSGPVPLRRGRFYRGRSFLGLIRLHRGFPVHRRGRNLFLRHSATFLPTGGSFHWETISPK